MTELFLIQCALYLFALHTYAFMQPAFHRHVHFKRLVYCGFCLSGHFVKSGFVRLDLPGFVRLDLFGSKSPLKGTRELKIAAKFDLDTDRPHKKELLTKT